MADTLASGASSRKGVRVQVPPRPPSGVHVDPRDSTKLHRHDTLFSNEFISFFVTRPGLLTQPSDVAKGPIAAINSSMFTVK